MRDRQGWSGRAVQTAVNAGSELLIFVPQRAHSDDLSVLIRYQSGQVSADTDAPGARRASRIVAGTCET